MEEATVTIRGRTKYVKSDPKRTHCCTCHHPLARLVKITEEGSCGTVPLSWVCVNTACMHYTNLNETPSWKRIN